MFGFDVVGSAVKDFVLWIAGWLAADFVPGLVVVALGAVMVVVALFSLKDFWARMRAIGWLRRQIQAEAAFGMAVARETISAKFGGTQADPRS